jgi:hypothetical protein
VLVVRAAVIWVPLGPMAPVQPPDPVQAVALVEFHISVLVAPLPTVVGVALIVAVGGSGSSCCPALHAISSSKPAIDRAWAKNLALSMPAGVADQQPGKLSTGYSLAEQGPHRTNGNLGEGVLLLAYL